MRVVVVRQLIPEGLAEMVPGPELAVVLAGIDVSALIGTDAVEVLGARARQLSHEQAQLLPAMVEVGLCDPDAEPDEVAGWPSRRVMPLMRSGRPWPGLAGPPSGNSNSRRP